MNTRGICLVELDELLYIGNSISWICYAINYSIESCWGSVIGVVIGGIEVGGGECVIVEVGAIESSNVHIQS